MPESVVSVTPLREGAGGSLRSSKELSPGPPSQRQAMEVHAGYALTPGKDVQYYNLIWV